MKYQQILEFARENRKNLTEAEQEFWSRVRNRKFHNLKFTRQFIIEYQPQSYFIADFHCHEYKLIFELDGPIHRFNKQYDEMRNKLLTELEFSIIHYRNEEVLNRWNEVEDDILKRIRVQR